VRMVQFRRDLGLCTGFDRIFLLNMLGTPYALAVQLLWLSREFQLIAFRQLAVGLQALSRYIYEKTRSYSKPSWAMWRPLINNDRSNTTLHHTLIHLQPSQSAYFYLICLGIESHTIQRPAGRISGYSSLPAVTDFQLVIV
jgi:hypothetical protein